MPLGTVVTTKQSGKRLLSATCLAAWPSVTQTFSTSLRIAAGLRKTKSDRENGNERGWRDQHGC